MCGIDIFNIWPKNGLSLDYWSVDSSNLHLIITLFWSYNTYIFIIDRRAEIDTKY